MSKYPQYQKRAVLKAASDIAGGRVAVHLDVYDVLQAFGITNPAQAHAVKKILRAGNDHLSFEQDIQEVKDSLDRAVELDGFREFKQEPEEIRYFIDPQFRALMVKLREDGSQYDLHLNCENDRTWHVVRSKHLLDYFTSISEAEARKLVEQAGGVW